MPVTSASEAIDLLARAEERKRRAALRRAVLIYNADERGAAAAGK